MAAYPYLEQFSAGYDMAGMTVTPVDENYPQIHEHVYRDLQNRGEVRRDTGTPVLFRSPGHNFHFEVKPDAGVRIDSIELPFDMVEHLNVKPVPSFEEFLVARPRHAVRLHRLANMGDVTID